MGRMGQRGPPLRTMHDQSPSQEKREREPLVSQASAAEEPVSAAAGQKYDADANVVDTSDLLEELGFTKEFLVQEIGVDLSLRHI